MTAANLHSAKLIRPATPIHPATLRLLWLQSRGRRRRIWRGFCRPRRMALSALAGLLAIVWLGNAAMTIWLRETGSHQTLRGLLSFGLALYAGWHFTKAAFFRPESPFDWTPGERDTLLAMPLAPRDLVAHQLASVTLTTLLKAGLFTLLLLPDLSCVPLGLVGIVLAMMTLEMLRMAIDIAAWGMSAWAYRAYRAAVVAGLLAAAVAVGGAMMGDFAAEGASLAGAGVRQQALAIVLRLMESRLGVVALPFQPLIDLILAERLTAGMLGLAVAATAALAGMAGAVMSLYAATVRRMNDRERRGYRPGAFAPAASASAPRRPEAASGGASEKRLVRRIPRLAGAGPLAWRQLVGARRHWGSLLTAMIAPAVFASAPCFVVAEPHLALVTTTGTLAFYTFLLLPTALRFDFRRDLDRLATLKGLPIGPVAAALGQTLAPVVIATLFQAAVLAFAVAARSLPPHDLLVPILVLIPLNLLVFGLDNLIYLLYPYRVQQEGLEIFVRTMLTFTGKGLLFTAGMVAVAGWGFAASSWSEAIAHMSRGTISGLTVFLAGIVAGQSLLAALVLYGLCRTYHHMDPIEGVPR